MEPCMLHAYSSCPLVKTRACSEMMHQANGHPETTATRSKHVMSAACTWRWPRASFTHSRSKPSLPCILSNTITNLDSLLCLCLSTLKTSPVCVCACVCVSDHCMRGEVKGLFGVWSRVASYRYSVEREAKLHEELAAAWWLASHCLGFGL